MNKCKLAVILIIASLLFSQEPLLHGQEFIAGIFGGINSSQVDRDGYAGYTNLSLTGGAFVNREISQDFFWQLEIKYGGRGAYYLDLTDVSDFSRTSFQYIELPLSVHYIHKERYQIEIGISPDVLLGFAAYNDQRDRITNEELLEGNNRFGINGFAGVGYWFFPTLGINLRWSYSIVPYSEREGAAVRYLDRGYFHNVLSLTLSYKIFHPR
jgi:hypothetical protein